MASRPSAANPARISDLAEKTPLLNKFRLENSLDRGVLTPECALDHFGDLTRFGAPPTGSTRKQGPQILHLEMDYREVSAAQVICTSLQQDSPETGQYRPDEELW